MEWHSVKGRFLTGTDAVTGNTITFSVSSIAAIRQLKSNTVGIVLINGLEYEVEGTHDEVCSAIGMEKVRDGGRP